MTTPAITFQTVPAQRRMGFLPQHFGMAAMLSVENRVYRYAELALEGYAGGLWEFVEASNGAGYMVPPKDLQSPQALPGSLRLKAGDLICNGAVLSRDAAGLALTVLAVNHEWHRRPDYQPLEKAWIALMDAVAAHPESRALLRVLD